MMSYNIYQTVPSAPEDPQVDYHLNIIQNKQQGLLKLEERYKKKYKKYTKTLNRLVALNACASGLSVATGIFSVATLSTFAGLPVSVSLGAVSLAGASVSGVTTVLTEVCSLLEWCFIISIGVSSDHSQLRCTGFAGGH